MSSDHASPSPAVAHLPISDEEPLMTPAVLRAMPDDQVLYLFANKRPALLGVKPYFERGDFKRRTASPSIQAVGGGVAARVEFVPL